MRKNSITYQVDEQLACSTLATMTSAHGVQGHSTGPTCIYSIFTFPETLKLEGVSLNCCQKILTKERHCFYYTDKLLAILLAEV